MFFLTIKDNLEGEFYIYDPRTKVGNKVFILFYSEKGKVVGYRVIGCTEQTSQSFRRTVTGGGIALEGFTSNMTTRLGEKIFSPFWPKIEGRTVDTINKLHSGL